MSFRHLQSLFNPRSIAVIGATVRHRRMGNVLMRNLLAGTFAGPIMPVNPKYESVAGVLTYPNVAALPQTPDLAIICTPPKVIPELIEQLGRRGTRAVIVMANQLATTIGADGRPVSAAILEATRRHGIRLLGGSTLGILVPGLGLNATFSQIQVQPGKLAFVSQRDAVGTMVLDWALRKKVGLSYFVSLGDGLDIGFGEVLDFLGSDSDTRAILLYIESIHERRSFMAAARAAARNKPVVAIKAGRSPNNRLLGVSDPLFLDVPNLVSSDDVHDAVLRRAGILRVDHLDEMFGAVETVLRSRPLRGNRLVAVSNGGGAGVMVEDSLYLSGYMMPPLKEQTVTRLRRILSPDWDGQNPIEIKVDSAPSRYEEVLKVLQEEQDGDAVLLMHTPNALSKSMDVAHSVIKTVREIGGNVMTCWVGDESVAEERRLFVDAGIATFDTPEHAASAFLHMFNHRIASEVLTQVPPSEPVEFRPDVARARGVIRAALDAGCTSLSEADSKAILEAYGIPVVQTHLAATPEEAGRIAERIGLPVALTVMSRDIRRKWDVGGIALNLETAEAVEAAAHGMLARVGSTHPDATIGGFTVQRMVLRGHARQLLIGVTTDALFGPLILFGEGGRALEIYRGLGVGLPPLNLPLAHDLIDRTKAAALLDARPHLPAADRDAIALTLTKVSQIVVDLPEIAELDINPLFADEKGVQAIDAHIRLSAEPRQEYRLAIQPYPKALEEKALLRDGREILLRPIRPEDEPAHYDFLSRLTRQDFTYRFFHYIPKFPRREMARLTQIDYDREMAFIASAIDADGKPETLGVARAVADPDNDTAEFALVIRSDIKRQRLATLLMNKLMNYARQRGIRRFIGDVMSENEPMLKLLQFLEFRFVPSGESGIVRAELDLQPAARAAPATQAGAE
ncbi:bifunctional acetate--CoA ligase family protein/GNAT family N-acetyltransferase [Thauera aromatica]|nr:bifunctional acetate--CoA ligase family protein/GNAT family N-acetyltransferase [Thauera aromatica]MCK2125628.1 bifunctional acetate--CoA ligase family protein/GNAT family N-acetyltransferase [Thauera aromatica]